MTLSQGKHNSSEAERKSQGVSSE